MIVGLSFCLGVLWPRTAPHHVRPWKLVFFFEFGSGIGRGAGVRWDGTISYLHYAVGGGYSRDKRVASKNMHANVL